MFCVRVRTCDKAGLRPLSVRMFTADPHSHVHAHMMLNLDATGNSSIIFGRAKARESLDWGVGRFPFPGEGYLQARWEFERGPSR